MTEPAHDNTLYVQKSNAISSAYKASLSVENFKTVENRYKRYIIVFHRDFANYSKTVIAP